MKRFGLCGKFPVKLGLHLQRWSFWVCRSGPTENFRYICKKGKKNLGCSPVPISLRCNQHFGQNLNGTVCLDRTMSFHFLLVSSSDLWPVGLGWWKHLRTRIPALAFADGWLSFAALNWKQGGEGGGGGGYTQATGHDQLRFYKK